MNQQAIGTVEQASIWFLDNGWVYQTPEGEIQSLNFIDLVTETAICRLPQMVELLTQDIATAKRGFQLSFSDEIFPGYQAELHWHCEELEGNWYRWVRYGIEGWIGTGLLHYFPTAPQRLYLKASPLPATFLGNAH
jgi:hypothetical protein